MNFDIETMFFDDAEAENIGLNKLGGIPVGVKTENWPRYNNYPMQHLLTLDFSTFNVNKTNIKPKADFLILFIDSYINFNSNSSDGLKVVWLTKDEVKSVGKSSPPNDFIIENKPEYLEETFCLYENDDDDLAWDESFLGASLIWNEEDKREHNLPKGNFIFQAYIGDIFIYVYDNGAYIYSDPEEILPPNWNKAIKKTKEIVVIDEKPASNSIQKWGGIPVGINEYDWPRGYTHLFTIQPPSFPNEDEAIAVAVFSKLKNNKNWQNHLDFFETVYIYQEDLDEEDIYKPKKVLEEKTLEIKEIPENYTWRDLLDRSIIGPRLAHRYSSDEAFHYEDEYTEARFQIASNLLPHAPNKGSLYFNSEGEFPYWQQDLNSSETINLIKNDNELEQEFNSKTNLGDDLTTSAIIVGWTFEFEEFDVEEEIYDEVLSVLDEINKENKSSLNLYIPGDTSDTGIIPNIFIIGKSIIELYAEEESEPIPFSYKKILEEISKMPKLNKTFFKERFKNLSESIEEYSNKAKAYLSSWGPLCYGSICIGSIQTNQDMHYEFITNQDYNQEWSSIGLDGISLETVEFTDTLELKFSDKKFDKDKEKVKLIKDPSYILTVRYD